MAGPAPASHASCSGGASSARLWAFVPCAGVGARAVTAGAPDLPKQYQLVAGQPLVLHTLAALAQVKRLSATLVGVAAGDRFFATEPLSMALALPTDYEAGMSQHRGTEEGPPRTEGAVPLGGSRASGSGGVTVVACGGATRAETVLGGLAALTAQGAADSDWVLVHDAARCLLTPQMVDRLIDACLEDPVGGLLAQPLADTLKCATVAGDARRVAATLARSDKWLAQTPQMFRLGLLREALQSMGAAATDEASAIEALGLQPRLVVGSAQNFKVTYAEDFALAAAVLESRQRALG